jgi:DNA-binding transcriptional ArsR family regulator
VLEAERRLAELELVLGAIAHATRRQILLTIWFRGGALSAGDIAARFHCAWPTISRHIKVLEDAGLLVQEKKGRFRHYRVDKSKLDTVKEWMGWFDQPAL